MPISQEALAPDRQLPPPDDVSVALEAPSGTLLWIPEVPTSERQVC